MSVFPSRQIASGVGTPRLIKEMERSEKYKTGTASQSTTVITGVGTSWTANMVNGIFLFADGTKRTITGFTDGTHLTAAESGTVASQSYELTHYASEYYRTAGTTSYTATSVVDSVALPTTVKEKMRIRAFKVNSGFAGTLCYAKIIGVNPGANTIIVDEWVGGTPSNGEPYIIDGYIADMPRTNESGLEETFEPDILVHELWRAKKETKQYGYKYSARLDYSTFTSPDMLFDMRDVARFRLSGSDENLIFIPRKDKPQYNYNVFISGGLNFGIHPSMVGHTGLTIELEGKDNVALPAQFFALGYGIGYAQNYGEQM